MNYKKFENKVLVRLDPGDEIVESLLKLAKSENIQLANISGIGAIDDFEVGVFDLDTHEYDKKHFTGNHEITNLCGSLTTKDGENYQHVHITAANASANCVGGHLLKAKVSLTAEIIIEPINGQIERKYNENLHINQWEI